LYKLPETGLPNSSKPFIENAKNVDTLNNDIKKYTKVFDFISTSFRFIIQFRFVITS
ncbi:unnamed protein product, partial [marine sediment metagenome]